MFKGIYDWLDQRILFHEWLKKDVLDKPIPKGINFSYCFGGITFFLFIMLAATGYIMTIYYIPSPDHAYDSLDYITYEVAMGSIIRGVHYWAANLMVITCVLHMVRVYIYGAFKKPQELNWMSGVLLFMLVLTFGFTGYLLPWDQTAYWGTKVGSSMMGTIPFAGDFALKLMRGGTRLGALTLARFYSLHVIFLPMITMLLLGVHFFMIRRLGLSKPL